MSKFIKSTLALVTLALVCLVALTTVKAADADETRESYGTVIGIGKSPPPLLFFCLLASWFSFRAFYLLSCLLVPPASFSSTTRPQDQKHDQEGIISTINSKNNNQEKTPTLTPALKTSKNRVRATVWIIED